MYVYFTCEGTFYAFEVTIFKGLVLQVQVHTLSTFQKYSNIHNFM